jgi:hypothetical protein
METDSSELLGVVHSIDCALQTGFDQIGVAEVQMGTSRISSTVVVFAAAAGFDLDVLECQVADHGQHVGVGFFGHVCSLLGCGRLTGRFA